MHVPVVLALFVCLHAAALVEDWPRFGGPSGDFQVPAPSAPLRWPSAGPKTIWKRTLGDGYASIAVEGQTLFTMYRHDGKEFVVSLDANTGKTIWEFSYDAPLQPAFDHAATEGPRSTPLIAGDAIITSGVTAKVHCLDKKTGKIRWSRDLVHDFDGQLRNNGYSASPLAWKDTVIVTPWAPNAAIAALKISDGTLVWKKHSYVVSYSSPTILKIGGQEQLVTMFSNEVTGLDPANGNLIWSFPHANPGTLVNVALPVLGDDGLMFLSSGYGTGARALKITGSGASTKVEQVWEQALVRVHHSDVVRIGDVAYGASGDVGPCPLTATDVKMGKLLWRDRTFPKASLVAVGSQLILVDEDGNLGLATPGPKGLEVQGKAQVLQNISWTPPTVIGKRIYLRDLKTIMAVELE
jgi:outer membrane protein assembly factor BamB